MHVFILKQNTGKTKYFVRQSLREGGIPFKITEGKPNQETVTAMLEAERIARDSSVKEYSFAQ